MPRSFFLHKIPGPLFLLSLVAGCIQNKDSSVIRERDSAFYQNSMRRSAGVSDPSARAILSIPERGCTAFFIANNANKNLAATAIHCFEGNPETWCSSGGKVWDTHIQKYRFCKRVAIFNPRNEMLVLEIDGPSPLQTLALSPVKYPVGTRLQMLGYPSDQNRSRGINMTENCWILKDVAPADRLTPRVQAMKETHFLHNCSTYSGNSGGPMLLEGTQVAIAMPSSFVHNDPNQRDSRPGDQYAIAGLEFKRFVELNGAAIEREKIKILNVAFEGPRPYSSQLVLHPGAFECSEMPLQEMVVKPIYNSSDKLQRLTFWYKQKGSASYGSTYESSCMSDGTATLCTASNSANKEQIIIMDAKSYVVIKDNGDRHQCQFNRAFSL